MTKYRGIWKKKYILTKPQGTITSWPLPWKEVYSLANDLLLGD